MPPRPTIRDHAQPCTALVPSVVPRPLPPLCPAVQVSRMTPVEVAVKTNNMEALDMLLRPGTVPINEHLPRGVSLLHQVSRQGNIPVMRLLIAWAADINAVSKREGASILYDAVCAQVVPQPCTPGPHRLCGLLWVGKGLHMDSGVAPPPPQTHTFGVGGSDPSPRHTPPFLLSMGLAVPWLSSPSVGRSMFHCFLRCLILF